MKGIEKRGKRLLRGIFSSLVRPERVDGASVRTDAVRRILLVRQDARLGNLILMTPLLRGMKAAFPDARLDVLVSGGFEEIPVAHEAVDNVLVFDKRRAKLQPWWYLRFVRSIRCSGYDLAVDVSDGRHYSTNNMLLTALSGARYRLAYDRRDAAEFCNLLVQVPPETMHFSDAMLLLAKYFSTDIADYDIEYACTEEGGQFAGSWLAEHGLDGEHFIVVHPGGKAHKRWGAERFAELVGRIAGQTGMRTVVVAADADTDQVETMGKLCGDECLFLENVSVDRMAAVIERGRVFVSGDTGPMHVAAALGRPQVAIFISSDFRQYGPRGSQSRIVVGDGEIPSIEDVMIAVVDLLENTPGEEK